LTKELEKTEEFSVTTLPHGVIVAANRADGDIEAFAVDLDFEHPDVDLSKTQMREVIQYVADQRGLDLIAGTPSSTEAMSRLIDDSMQREIVRLNRDVRILSKIADSNPALDIEIKHSGEVINAVMARGRLSLALADLSGFRKLLSEKTKAEGSGDGTQVNIQNNFSMQSMMTEGLQRIDEELDVDAKTI